MAFKSFRFSYSSSFQSFLYDLNVIQIFLSKLINLNTSFSVKNSHAPTLVVRYLRIILRTKMVNFDTKSSSCDFKVVFFVVFFVILLLKFFVLVFNTNFNQQLVHETSITFIHILRGTTFLTNDCVCMCVCVCVG